MMDYYTHTHTSIVLDIVYLGCASKTMKKYTTSINHLVIRWQDRDDIATKWRTRFNFLLSFMGPFWHP